jgi:cysteine-rich repeat protein
VELQWTHAGAAEFHAFVDQPTFRAEPLHVVWTDPVPDADGFYRLIVSDVEPDHEADVFLLAVDEPAEVSPPSNIIRIGVDDFCGVETCGDAFTCTHETCTVSDCMTTTDNTRCNDGNTCTLDFCSLTTGCINLNAIGSCDDGLDCTIKDICADGSCQGTDDCPADFFCSHDSGECEPLDIFTTTTLASTTTTVPTTTTTTVPSTCGNGELDDDEQCDDGDTAWKAGDVCLGNCALVICGDTDASGTLSVVDALFVLQTALGTYECDPAVCDVDSTHTAISVSDALRLLRAALGLPVELNCPPPVLTRKPG